jgi:flagellar basal-body rod protein FlgB
MQALFTNLNVINKVLDATVLRKNVIDENISNADTPGYKRKDVKFETMLLEELSKNGYKKLDINNIEPIIYVDKANFSYRMDDNNVDIDVEMVENAKVQLRYNTLIERTASQIERYKSILQTIK